MASTINGKSRSNGVSASDSSTETQINGWTQTKRIAAIAGIALAGLAICWLSPSFFCLGLVVGLVASAQVLDAAKHIGAALDQLKTWQKVIIFIAVVGVGGFFFLPHLVAVVSFGFAAYWGARLIQLGKGDQPQPT